MLSNAKTGIGQRPGQAKPQARPAQGQGLGRMAMPGVKLPQVKVNLPLSKIIGALIALFILYSVYSWAANSLSIVSLGGPTAFSVGPNSAVFVLNGNEYSLALVSANTNITMAKVALSRLPNFINPTKYVALYSGIPVYVNTSGQYADISIKLVNVTAGNAKVEVAPVAVSDRQSPSAAYISSINTMIYSKNNSQNLTQLVNSIKAQVPPAMLSSQPNGTAAATTAPPAGQQNASQPTQAQNATQQGDAKAMALLQKSVFYPIMLNYTSAYANTLSCGSALYNSTYASRHSGAQPSGQATYANVSQVVPYMLRFSLSNSTPSLYKAIYSTVSHSAMTTGPAMLMVLNITSGSIDGTAEGVFYGEAPAMLQAGLYSANKIGNACGIYLVGQ